MQKNAEYNFSVTVTGKNEGEIAEADISVSGLRDPDKIIDFGVVTAANALAYAYVVWLNNQEVLENTPAVRKMRLLTFCDQIAGIFDRCVQDTKDVMKAE